MLTKMVDIDAYLVKTTSILKSFVIEKPYEGFEFVENSKLSYLLELFIVGFNRSLSFTSEYFSWRKIYFCGIPLDGAFPFKVGRDKVF